MSDIEDEKPVEKVQEVAEQAARAETASPPVRRYRNLIFRSGLFLVVLLFAVLSFFVSTREYLPIDLTLTRSLQFVDNSFFAQLMSWVSWPGFTPQAFVLTGLLGAALYLFGFHWEAVVALGGAGLVEGVNALVKYIVHRPRPSPDLVNVVKELSTYSFPSGHVMFYTAFFGFLFFLAFTVLRPSWLRTFFLALFGGLIFLVGASRVYLGQHWTSDVIGAYLLGSLVLVFIIEIYRWGKGRYFKHQPAAPEKVVS